MLQSVLFCIKMTEELTLNIISDAPTPSKKKSSVFRGKVSRNRKQRINQRRKLKKRISKLGSVNSDGSLDLESDDKIHLSSSKLHQTTEISKKYNNFKKNNGKNFLKKSILVGNPEIPVLDCTSKPVQPKTKYTTNRSFTDLDIHSGLKSYIKEKLNLDEMTPVQSQSIPVLLSGKDVLIRSQTGSGKTLAYAISVVQSLQSISPPVNRENGPMAIVLTPTRELALQSYSVFHQLTLPVRRIVPTCVMGGQKRKSEKARLRKGVNIIISTPGRFTDHLQNTSCLDLKNIRWLVFDEADRLLDMGFQKDINEILTAVKEQSKEKQQTALLSATLNNGVEKLVDLALTDPVRITVNSSVSSNKQPITSFVDPATGLNIEKVALPDKLRPFIVVVPSKLRLVALLAFIMSKHRDQLSHKTLVFLSCRDSVQFHFELLKTFTVWDDKTLDSTVLQLHGGMNQDERTTTVKKFKSSDSSVLLCTDVAARGLDIPRVDWVVQYTCPGNPVDYIHRVGRTARAGREGNAILFLTPSEVSYVKLLFSFAITAGEVKVEDILCGLLDKKANKHQFNVRVEMAKERASELHKSLEAFIHGNKMLKACAAKAFAAFIRAYTTYPSSLKHIFHVKNLHIGHVAKSFALQETPSEALRSLQNSIGQRALQQMRRKKPGTTNKQHTVDNPASKNTDESAQSKTSVPKQKAPVKRHPIVAKFDLMSEFSSGLDNLYAKRLKRN